ncbi:MAG TPA: hypothetical protein VEL05_00525 [Candidatus Acidoferrum sp.]|nr:hypothetical protein [Candidatus Acidoferrum sp.]
MLARLGEVMDPHLDDCAECRAGHAEYAKIAAALARGSDRPLPAGWKERALARLRRAELARRRRTVLAAGLAIAAALLLFIALRPTARATLAVSIDEGGGDWRGPAHPGGRLRVAARAGTAERFELRIYRETRELVVRCPGDASPTCRPRGDAVDVSLPLAVPGEYQIVWLVSSSSSPLPPPSGDLDADVRAARAAGAHVAGSEVVDVT